MSSGNKTRPQPSIDVAKFLSTLRKDEIREDCQQLYTWMADTSGTQGVLWGKRIVGFGTYHYVYATGREGDWMRMGFGPLANGVSIYVTPYEADGEFKKDLAVLGKHKMGKGCLQIRRLSDVHVDVLQRIIEKTWRLMEERYPTRTAADAKRSVKRTATKKATAAKKAVTKTSSMHKKKAVPTKKASAMKVKKEPARKVKAATNKPKSKSSKRRSK